ncbi:MAG: AAA family ATPase, partial [Bryobacteraceae bacterium]
QLLSADFSPETAQDLVQAAARRASEEEGRPPRVCASGLEAVVTAEIERRLRIAPEIGEREPGRRVALFAGPPGAGKTSLLVKIAVACGIKLGVPVQILSTDTLRVGAVEQLSAYARIMGAGFQAVHTVSAFAQALEEHRAKKLVLIDTPGYAANEMEEARELAGFLGRQRQIEVHLLLPALLRQSVLARIVERFEIFAPSKLAFTHFDEAGRPGAVLDQAIRTGIPVSFLSRGQKIPEDVGEASKAALLENLWEPAEAAAVSAA